MYVLCSAHTNSYMSKSLNYRTEIVSNTVSNTTALVLEPWIGTGEGESKAVKSVPSSVHLLAGMKPDLL